MRRAIILLAAAAAVATWSLATPALACDGHKAEAAAVTAKADDAKATTAEAKGGCEHAAKAAAVTADAKSGCPHAAKAAAIAAEGAVAADGKPVVVKASAEEGTGCAKKCAKAASATVAKAEEPKPEETKTK